MTVREPEKRGTPGGYEEVKNAFKRSKAMQNIDQEETRKYKMIKRSHGEKSMLMKDAELDYFVKIYVYEMRRQKLSKRDIKHLNKE